MNLYDALTEILTDPGRSSLYSGSQLVKMLRLRGIQLPADQMEAWELVSDARYEIEMAHYRDPSRRQRMLDREKLGELVRLVWIECAYELPHPKPSHVLPWAELDDWNKEVDRRIGERIAQYVLEQQKVAGQCHEN